MTLRLPPNPGGIAEACRILAAGGLVAFPTETVYGLGADATRAEAAARIYAAKGRPSFNPLIAHVADLAAAEREGVFDGAASRLARAFWPGPLTLVVPAQPGGTVSELSRAGLASVGLRIPSHPVAQTLLRAFGRPIAAPSANRSGHVSPTSAEHVLADLDGVIDAIIDAGATPVGIESTIAGCDGSDVYLLRPGSITRAELSAAAGCAVLDTPADDAEAPRAPGRLSAHYAPRTPVRLNAVQLYDGEALLAFGPDLPAHATKACMTINLSETGDMREAASHLYDALRRLDACGATTIAIARIPSEGLGEAIADRISRAAAGARPIMNT